MVETLKHISQDDLVTLAHMLDQRPEQLPHYQEDLIWAMKRGAGEDPPTLLIRFLNAYLGLLASEQSVILKLLDQPLEDMPLYINQHNNNKDYWILRPKLDSS